MGFFSLQYERKKLGTKNSKRKQGRQEKNGGVKGRDSSAEELDRDTGEEQTTVDRMADDRLPKRAAEIIEQEETRAANAEMGGPC